MTIQNKINIFFAIKTNAIQTMYLKNSFIIQLGKNKEYFKPTKQ